MPRPGRCSKLIWSICRLLSTIGTRGAAPYPPQPHRRDDPISARFLGIGNLFGQFVGNQAGPRIGQDFLRFPADAADRLRIEIGQRGDQRDLDLRGQLPACFGRAVVILAGCYIAGAARKVKVRAAGVGGLNLLVRNPTKSLDTRPSP